MTFRVKKLPIPSLDIRKLVIDREFDQVFQVPRTSDTDTPQNFCTATDIYYDPGTMTVNTNVMDGNGKVSFELNFYVDTEEALKANVRKVRFKIYAKDPNKKIGTTIDSPVGSIQYFNERYLQSMVNKSCASGRSGYGLTISNSANNELPKINRLSSLPSKLWKFNDGTIKVIETILPIDDTNVSRFSELSRLSALSARQFINAGFSFATRELAQNYEIDITPKINLNSCQGNDQIKIQGRQGSTAGLNPLLARNAGTVEVENRVETSQRALFQSRTDPASIYDKNYYSRDSGANPGQTKEPGSVSNEIQVGRGGKELDNNFVSASPENRQSSTVQRTPSFSGQPHLESLYRSSADIRTSAVRDGLLASVPVRKLFFKSSLRQYREEFDLDLNYLRPYTNGNLYIETELLARDGSVYKKKTFTVNLRRQLRSVLTPEIAPTLKVQSQKENRVVLQVEQQDPLATHLSIYRMTARPEELDETSWVRVGSVRMNVKRGTFNFVDDTIRSNVSPNIVVYEARCNGIFGGACPTTNRIVVAGVKKAPNLHKNRNRGQCSIVAKQNGNRIVIDVSRVPIGVTRIFLRRQLINTALKKRDFREHLLVPTDDVTVSHEVEKGQSAYRFVDKSTVNRQLYRYYAQFDWKDYPRSNSVSEDYIEYRRLPDRPIVSSLSDLQVTVDDTGSSQVKFMLNATFTNEGLDELNKILGNDGVSTVFVEELKKDRSLISNFLLFKVTRKNLRNQSVMTFPLLSPGEFVDDTATRRRASAGSATDQELVLRAGYDYLYRAQLLIINPERFFKEALTRIPASTKQIILNTNPDFIQVSAAKFAENFAIQPGTIQSPTTLEKDVSFRDEAVNSFTGIEFAESVTIPASYAIPRDVNARKDVVGRPANVISWKIRGSIESVYAFRVDVTIGRDQTVPLRSVSPNVISGDSFVIRDEIYTREIVPVSYSVTAIYTNQTESATVKSNEIYAGSNAPVRIIDRAVKKWLRRIPEVRLPDITEDAFRSRLDKGIDENPLYAGARVRNDLSNRSLDSELTSVRNTELSGDGVPNVAINPKDIGR